MKKPSTRMISIAVFLLTSALLAGCYPYHYHPHPYYDRYDDGYGQRRPHRHHDHSDYDGHGRRHGPGDDD